MGQRGPAVHCRGHSGDAAQVKEILSPSMSAATTDLTLREIAAVEKLLTLRANAIEKAVEVAHENLVRVPTEVDKAVGHLRDVMLEKFATTDQKLQTIELQFHERDVRVEQTARDTKVAIDAALAAQEKGANKQTESFIMSIAKSETATAKQIDQQSQLLISTTRGLNDKIDDIKDRITRLEGEGRGLKAAETSQQTSNMNLVSVIGLIVGALVGIAGVVMAIIGSTRP
jgi:hypothetical protein